MLIGKLKAAAKKAFGLQRREDHQLFLAAMSNTSWGLVKELAGKYPGAVRWRDEQGATALHHAAIYRDAPMIEWLLDHGAEIEAQDKRGFRALHHAAQCAGDDPTAALLALLRRGAEIDPRSHDGTTPLMYAATRNKPWNVRELIIAGADENAADNAGVTPHMEALNARSAAPDLYQAIAEGHAERLRRAEAARIAAEEAQKKAVIDDAIASISNGLTGALSVRKPVRLKR